MKFSEASIFAWLGSTAIAVFVLAARYFDIGTGLPLWGSAVRDSMFEMLLAAYLLLWLGTAFSKV
jgi:hypothetical protein